jgi:hypothetical protein
MTAIINGDSPSITFSDATTQATSAVVSGKVPYSILPAGSVLQVVSATYGTEVTNSTSTYADSGLTATITPKFSTSKILVLVNQNCVLKETNNTGAQFKIVRNSTDILQFTNGASFTNNTNSNTSSASAVYLDSPATTSATTYKTQFASQNNNAIVKIQLFGSGSTSTITLMEIAG